MFRRLPAFPGYGSLRMVEALIVFCAVHLGSSALGAQADRVETGIEADVMLVHIQHVRGIGRAAIRAPATGWPSGVHLRFHDFPALESFGARACSAVFECELQRPQGRPAQYRCALDGHPTDGVRRTADGFQIDLPTAMLAPATESIELRWVDQWR